MLPDVAAVGWSGWLGVASVLTRLHDSLSSATARLYRVVGGWSAIGLRTTRRPRPPARRVFRAHGPERPGPRPTRSPRPNPARVRPDRRGRVSGRRPAVPPGRGVPRLAQPRDPAKYPARPDRGRVGDGLGGAPGPAG